MHHSIIGPAVAVISIVSPGYPDLPGGVTDHTRRISTHFRNAGHVVQVFGDSFDRLDHTEGPSGSPPDVLLLQYVPFLYGRRGLSSVPLRIVQNAAHVGTRTIVFVHEPWVPPTRLAWRVLSRLQRRQLLKIVDQSDEVLTPVPAWRGLFGKPTKLMYIGSTLPTSDDQPSHTYEAPVVFSPFASGLNWEWIRGAIDAISAPDGAVVIGATHQDAVQRGLSPWTDNSWTWLPRADADETVRRLTMAPIVLAPFIDGLTGRRTSAMAALAIGVRVISSTGHLFDRTFTNSPVATANTAHEFARDAARLWAASDTPTGRTNRRAWYRSRFDAKTLDDELLRLLLGDR